ncbi:uncharacterized protein LOC118754331 [Rhagoletis pomonella]|uniref:uncharacterized protein LOC118754331 n=1 Tax=Rhagoletis pomonella TaxID=28610 RepID=UPI001782E118|nr:uncharacterized protein LOC118754331 [Rhagoletis pomonella]
MSGASPPYTVDPISADQLEGAVLCLTKSLNECYITTCPESKPKRHPRWWKADLRRLRIAARKAFNKAKFTKNAEDWDEYRRNFNAFKKEIKKAKKVSWSKFCEDLETTTDAARLRRYLSKNPAPPGFLKTPGGGHTESSLETLEHLMNVHFPGCGDAGDTETPVTEHPSTHRQGSPVDEIITTDKVAWAIRCFQLYKSPGGDGIFPAVLQRSADHATPYSCEAQHAYRTLETALHEVVGSIEHALNHKEYALAAFLDVEGAFNNVNLASIHCSMVAVGLDPLITLWIDNMLSTRNINGSLGTSEVKKTATRGTPQGGCYPPYCGTSC